MPKLIWIFVICCLLAAGQARRKKVDLTQQKPAPQEKTTVVEANHFYSQTNKSTALNIGETVNGKPLIFLLKPNNAEQKSPPDFNEITVTIASDKVSQKCTIKGFYGICSLASMEGSKPTLKMECKNTPCEVRWELVQPETIEVDGQHKINHLVSINKDKNHAILKIFCSDPQLKDQVRTDLDLYTNSKYDKVVTAEGQVLYLFNNEEQGQYFLTTKNQAVEKCAEVTLQHAQEEVELKGEGYLLHDFLNKNETNDYLIKGEPKTDILVQILAHHAAMKIIDNSTYLTVQLTGTKDKKQTPIQYLTLQVDDQKEYIDFSAVFKKPEQKFDSYELTLKSNSNEYLITTITVIASNVLDVELEEESYFDLKKGQKIDYKVLPINKNITNIKKIFIEISNSQEFSVSKTSCPRDGCQFTVEALKDAQGSIYIGEDKEKKALQTVLQQFTKSVSQKIREGEQKFYLYKMQKGTTVQFMVNTPSVIVYIADKKKCEVQKLGECSQKQFNYHHPTIYEAKEQTSIVMKVVALDHCQYVITALQTSKPYIQLKDSEPFVYLMDDNENELLFHFSIKEKQDVSFNLVSGLNQMEIFVFNQEDLKEDTVKEAEESAYSLQGYVFMAKDDLQNKEFIIKVGKREEYRKKYVHFTLIASTKAGNLRLEAGNAHYQTLKADTSRDYVFQVQEEKNMFLNFFTQNLDKIDLQATLSRTDEYQNKSATAEYHIDRQTDVINIALVTQKLCGDEIKDCEIFVRVWNKMEVEADVTLTLMVRDVVVELKDGIWQTYDINEASSTAHFYFLPKHQKHSISIFYHSYNVNLRISYTLWKSDDTSIAMSKWPFPNNLESEDKENDRSVKPYIKPTRFIHIENSKLKDCWPNCVILLSVVPNQKQLENMEKKPSPFFNFYHNIKIMASNNLVEIPQKFKLDIALNQGEQKFVLVDLKYFLTKQSLVFFTYIPMGSVSFKANLYTQKNPQCPSTQEFEADYHLYGVENEIQIQDLKKKLEDKGMDSDKSPYLCILANAYSESKFSIEFVSESTNIKDIPIGTTMAIHMKKEETRIFQITANYKFFVKIARTSGFPYYSKVVCSPVKDMEKCLDQFKDNEDKGEQLVNKMVSLTQEPCMNCMFFIKITSQEQSHLSLHAESSYAQVQLKEKQPLNDVLIAKEINNYMITSSKTREVIVNIHILSGNIKVDLFDYNKVSVSRQNVRGNNNIHIVIPSADLAAQKNETGLYSPYFSSFALSSFVNLHVRVQLQEGEHSANYIITYSNGEQTAYLEDGLISQYTLIPQKQSKFLYNSASYGEPVYLYISTPEAETLNKLHPKIYGLDNEGDEDNRMELTPERPAFKKKTVNPTMLLHFTGKSHYRIEIDNKNTKEVVLSIGMNSRQIIYLPLEHEFPFKLQSKQYIYFVVPVSGPGFLTFFINKCDSSSPYIAYTDDYKQFVDEEFQSEEQLTQQLNYRNIIKIKKAGSLYLRVKAGVKEVSILTVKASFSTLKTQFSPVKAGDKGQIQYELTSSEKAQIIFSAAVCEGKCSGSFAYSAVISSSVDQIISHLVCTAVSFDFNNNSRISQPTIEPITSPRSSDNKITFMHTLATGREYVGVKAINKKTGVIVYYPPVELINLSGKIDKALETAGRDNNPYWIIGTVGIMSLCCLLVAWRRYRRNRQYIPLGGGNSAYDD